jgi:Predicted membrane protein
MSEQTLTKQADEKFCSSCGAIIKIAAEICPKCGVRQNAKKSIFETKTDIERKTDWRVLFHLSFWLGFLGIDRFYAGKTGSGILKLITMGGIGIWWVMDIINIANGNYTDATGKLVDKKGAKASKHFAISAGILIAWAIILNGIIIPNTPRYAPQSSSTISQPAKNAKVPVAELSATQLSNAYENNEIAADKTYKNKWIKVSGVVQNIGKDIKGNPNIILGDLYEGDFFVRVHFKNNNEIANLRKGQEITVVGQCQGMQLLEIGTVMMKVIIIEKSFFEE